MIANPPRRPERTEAADYYFRYIDQVSGPDVLAILASQRDEVLALCRTITEQAAEGRYADGKWTLREVLGHLNDTERLFVSRAFWFARGFDTPLPSFDPDVAMAHARFDARTWPDLVDEFAAVRDATLAFFRSLPPEAWDRQGIASGNPFSVRALAFLAAGHVTHHLAIVQARYLARP
jgi:hypothetical protein